MLTCVPSQLGDELFGKFAGQTEWPPLGLGADWRCKPASGNPDYNPDKLLDHRIPSLSPRQSLGWQGEGHHSDQRTGPFEAGEVLPGLSRQVASNLGVFLLDKHAV